MTEDETEEPNADAADVDSGVSAESKDKPVATRREPYGPAIHDAVASGDVQQMKAIAEGARRALYAVEFEGVTADRYDEVKDALDALEEAIVRLDQGRDTPP